MRNLVLLLSSGHTVRIALRENDLTEYGDGPNGAHVRDFLLNMPAVVADTPPEWIFAYVEDPSLPDFLPGGGMEREPLNDYQRISVESGVSVQYG